MCGICGFIERRSQGAARPDALSPMLARIAHRGPDGEGRTAFDAGDWRICLGHRRLSIIDLETGPQPMATTGCPITPTAAQTTYNGELYNFRELRRELEARGRVFRTRSDTEVLLCQIADRGE